MKCYVLILMICSCTALTFALPGVTKIQETIVDTDALTINNYGQVINGVSFQQNAIITHNGWQYVAYYHGRSGGSGIDGYVCVARRNLSEASGFEIGTSGTVNQSMFALSWGSSGGSGEWEIIELSDYHFTSNDAHCVVTMGICPNDGTIHLAFDHHDDYLNYRVSQTGVTTNPGSVTWDASLFGSTHSDLISGDYISGLSYPRFWQTPTGDLQFGYRNGGSGNGDWYMVNYSGTTHLWSNRHQVINRSGTYSDSVFTNSTSRNAYMNPLGYSPNGNFHASWTWRESSSDCNHDIMYAYSNDNGVTWYNNSGTEIADTSYSQVITLDSPGVTIVTLDTNRGMMNQQAQAIDSDGRVHTIMFYCNAPRSSGTFGRISQRRYYHNYRDTDGTWYQNELEFNTSNVNSYVGTRPKLFIRDNGDAYAIYQSWQSVSLTSTDIYITNGNLVIQAATAANNWNDWQIIHVETGPFVNEPLADPNRFEDGVLSVMMQDSPPSTYDWTTLRVLDFQLN